MLRRSSLSKRADFGRRLSAKLDGEHGEGLLPQMPMGVESNKLILLRRRGINNLMYGRIKKNVYMYIRSIFKRLDNFLKFIILIKRTAIFSVVPRI